MDGLEAPQNPGRVSIVMPVHNGMPYIKAALESALSQDHDDLEILVMENMSDDGTTEWLDRLDDPRIRVVKQPTLVLVDRNFSDAVAAASGEFLRILCADDLLKPGAVSAHLQAFDAHPDAVLVASTRDICDSREKVLIRARGLDGLGPVNTRRDVAVACAKYGTNVIGEPFCRTAAVKAELPFRPEPRYVLDVDLYVRALKHGTLATLQGCFSTYRVLVESYSAEGSKTQAAEFTEWVDLLSKDPALGLSSVVRKRSRRRARSNQYARSLVYRYLELRARLHKVGRKLPVPRKGA